MCIGTPGRILELVDPAHGIAAVDVAGERRTVNLGLLEGGTEVGDWVLVHLGFAVETMDEHEAKETLAFLRELGDPTGKGATV